VRIPRWLTAPAAASALLVALVPQGAVPASAATPRTAAALAKLPQVVPALAAGRWLAGQLLPQGYVPTPAGPDNPDYSSTANTVLALAAADVDPAGAATALRFMEAHLPQYVPIAGADGPGKLALLILDADALGTDPSEFGGTNLITRLLATQQHAGPDAGMFGTEAQVDDYAAGGYQQGLALAALAAAGVHGTSAVDAAVAWLVREECPDGGWTTPDNAVNGCSGSPADFSGPDTNSTALAAEGLAAQGAATPAITARVLAYYRAAQDPDAGWSYFPNTKAVPGATDPDSTALVVQALLALHSSPAGGAWAQGGADPVSALLKFQLGSASGSSSGAFFFPPAPSPANILATYQAAPALAGLALPFGPAGHGYLVAAANGGVSAFGDIHLTGSASGLTLRSPVVGIARTADGPGYRLAAADGGVFAFGGARYLGSAAALPLVKPVVGIAATPDGGGYWLVAADGGVFAYGDARYFGSATALHLTQPVVGIAATPDGLGYWLVAGDGGVFAYGDARYHGSAAGLRLVKPVVGIAATPDGLGYWLVAADGGVFTYGDARYRGSATNQFSVPVVAIAATPDGGGYWLLNEGSGVSAYGDAATYPTAAGLVPASQAVGLATGRP
jgi:hypothetical protein